MDRSHQRIVSITDPLVSQLRWYRRRHGRRGAQACEGPTRAQAEPNVKKCTQLTPGSMPLEPSIKRFEMDYYTVQRPVVRKSREWGRGTKRDEVVGRQGRERTLVGGVGRRR